MRSRFRLAVFVGLLIAQVGTVAALIAASGRLTDSAVSEHTDALLSTAAAESADRVRAHVAPAESIVAISSGLAAEPSVEPQDFAGTFLAALERSPQLAGAFIGTPSGEFVYVSRTDDGYRTKTIALDGADRRTNLVFHDRDGAVTDEAADPSDTFDPRTRPWYLEAVGSPDDVAWTDPYVFFTSRQLGITAARAIHRDGELIGVVGADIELASLSTFLTTLRVGDDGGTVIVNEVGTVVAHPDASIIQRPDGDGYRTVGVTELDDPSARAAIAELIEAGQDGRGLVHGFEGEAGASRVAFRSVPIGDGEWTIGVFGPTDGFVGILTEARDREQVLIIAVGALSMLLVALVAFPATRPIGKLEARAATDALTGLPNRRAVLAATDRATARPTECAAAMIDLDYFKLVNDTYGHQVGDQVLLAVAQRIESSVRGEATVGRVGGEEFLIAFDDVDRDVARAACERVSAAIRSTPIATTRGQVEMTASIGLATSRGSCTTDQLLACADTALLEAKQLGRDQLVVADVDGEDRPSSVVAAGSTPERVGD
ncbi:MAG: diguanylate cyclase [Ilumatobacter sp.]|uniref:GGDEF domain-containing protein n=1 Tax=Ilumatobacter sp. TaxID=1967498 RepID=UPI00261BF31A|nr:diguanylate cyclase [Ilumatobacter sp.]MDJ0770060.1 diguanylate cyclase [Ilumatobacter sp.]